MVTQVWRLGTHLVAKKVKTCDSAREDGGGRNDLTWEGIQGTSPKCVFYMFMEKSPSGTIVITLCDLTLGTSSVLWGQVYM